ncbi:MAG: hypothetical protein GXY55_18950 [Phycisphaerae bacterium]|nr:hypothetical protein [Phycisphaerae bacterium]
MRRFSVLALMGLAVGMCGMNCLPLFTPAEPRVAALRGFSSAEEMRQFLVEQADARMNADSWSGGWWRGGWLFMGAPTAAPDAGNAEDSGGGQPYSTTNIQEEGVDESDVVKNDGQYIYWLREDQIHILKAQPPEELAEIAQVPLGSYGDSLFLRDGRLIALSRQWGGWYWGPADVRTTTAENMVGGLWNDGSQVTVTVIDVSDPSAPTVEATVDFEGELASSRMIGNRLHLVVTSMPRLPDDPTPATLGGMTLEQWLPAYKVTDGDGDSRSGNIVGWADSYRPETGDGYAITTVVTLNVDNPTGEFASTAITANAGTIYASPDALYVADTAYDWNALISRTDTMVHKLAFTETGTRYVASGLVPGRPLGQYSLGEYQDHLRIATTLDEWSMQSGSSLSNAVYVLGENGTNLEVVGKVENMAPGEEIYAVRFVGPRGFVVTFERVDPLFVLDLSDATNPRVTGELKIPGYSDHIQMMDENHLLTIGKYADPNEGFSWAWVQGVQLSVFDVSDPADPQQKYVKIVGGRGTNSEANYNPKAFNYFPARGVVAFPIELYSDGTTGPEIGEHEFTGLMVYRVGPDTDFQEVGRLPTVDLNSVGSNCYWGYWGATRGIFIGDTVYAVSDLGAKAADLGDMSTILGEVFFDDESSWQGCWDDDLPILPEASGGLR